jgi:hypothetical protein
VDRLGKVPGLENMAVAVGGHGIGNADFTEPANKVWLCHDCPHSSFFIFLFVKFRPRENGGARGMPGPASATLGFFLSKLKGDILAILIFKNLQGKRLADLGRTAIEREEIVGIPFAS